MPLDYKQPNPERIANPQHPGSLVERRMAFVGALHAQSTPSKGRVADKAFVDGLYDKS